MSSNNAVTALLKPTSEHGRNVFPLDNRQIYSIKAGQVNPVKAIHFEPKSHFEITAHDFTMTFPMQTCPFLRGRKEFAFYSVYYNAVWSLFNQYQATRSDPKTSAFGERPILQEPRIRFADFYMSIFSQYFYYLAYEYVIPYFLRKNVDYTYGSYEMDLERFRREFLEEEYRGPFTINMIFEPSNGQPVVTFMFNLVVDYSGNYVPTIFGDSWSDHLNEEYCHDVVGHFRAYSWMRKLDMLGYGNLYPFFKNFESVIEGWITAASPEASYDSFATALNTLLLERMVYLLDTVRTGDSSNYVYKMCNLYPICAYNSIFYHFFRNSYYDIHYFTHNYNLDFVSVNPSEYGDFNQVSMSDFDIRFLDIEYHQWKKDTFTAVLPDTQFGAVSSISVGNFDNINIQSLNPYSSTQSLVVNTSNDRKVFVNGNSALDSFNILGVNSSFDVIALKRAEMLQEYRQQLLRAGNKTSDVFRALYGSAPSSEHEDDVIPRFLDTFGEDIFVDPVLATANTGESNPNGNLGDIAARGKFRGDSGKVTFNAGGNFGLILCLTYVVPESEYNSYMFDKHILELTPEDHYIQQFENLGLEPLLSDELNMLLPANNIHTLGFVPRYHHKKSEVDLIHGAFCSWGNPAPVYQSEVFFGDFNNWVSPRTDMQNRQSTSLRDFYINPSVLDNVFVRAAGADQADDQFICNTFFDITSVKEMSKVGLINFV